MKTEQWSASVLCSARRIEGWSAVWSTIQFWSGWSMIRDGLVLAVIGATCVGALHVMGD